MNIHRTEHLSELCRLMEQISVEYEAAQRGLTGLAQSVCLPALTGWEGAYAGAFSRRGEKQCYCS